MASTLWYLHISAWEFVEILNHSIIPIYRIAHAFHSFPMLIRMVKCCLWEVKNMTLPCASLSSNVMTWKPNKYFMPNTLSLNIVRLLCFKILWIYIPLYLQIVPMKLSRSTSSDMDSNQPFHKLGKLGFYKLAGATMLIKEKVFPKHKVCNKSIFCSITNIAAFLSLTSLIHIHQIVKKL